MKNCAYTKFFNELQKTEHLKKYHATYVVNKQIVRIEF